MEICSFNFPAVLNTFGAQKWPQLSKVYFQMVKSGRLQVRRPLACSMHEVARIIGPARAEKELIAALDSLLMDINEEVRNGAINNLTKFMSLFTGKMRVNLLDVFLILFVMRGWWWWTIVSDGVEIESHFHYHSFRKTKKNGGSGK